MKRLIIFIEDQSKEIELDESFLITHKNPYLLVKKVTVFFFKYVNVSTAIGNNEITYNNVKKTSEDGCWTFYVLKKEIESYGNVTLETNKHNGTCSITSGPILGFDKKQVINTNTKTTSKNEVNINNGLEYIEISCSLVKIQENINSNGKKSDVILTLPIASTQTLF